MKRKLEFCGMRWSIWERGGQINFDDLFWRFSGDFVNLTIRLNSFSKFWEEERMNKVWKFCEVRIR